MRKIDELEKLLFQIFDELWKDTQTSLRPSAIAEVVKLIEEIKNVQT